MSDIGPFIPQGSGATDPVSMFPEWTVPDPSIDVSLGFYYTTAGQVYITGYVMVSNQSFAQGVLDGNIQLFSTPESLIAAANLIDPTMIIYVDYTDGIYRPVPLSSPDGQNIYCTADLLTSPVIAGEFGGQFFLGLYWLI